MRRLTELLAEITAAEETSTRTGMPTLEILERRIERRDFLRKAAMTGVGMAAVPSFLAACTSNTKTSPAERPTAGASEGAARVVIVGAGLAGMTTAYRLWQAGYSPLVFEADDRFGGRTETVTDFFDGGQHIEECGDSINSNHKAMLGLVSELGLELDNLWSYYDGHLSGINWIDDQQYTRQQLVADFQEVYPALHRDTQAAPWPTTYDSYTDAALRLDNTTLAQWIDENVPGGRKSSFGKLIDVAYVGEYGLETEEQSALNLMYEMGYSTKDRFQLWGNQDWKWRVRGGNELVTKTIADKLPDGSITLESPLRAILKKSDGTYALSFDQGARTVDVGADRVVLTLPFTALRSVDYSKAGFDSLKDKAIRTLGMGTNARLYIQFSDKVWEKQGLSGDSITDLPFQETEIVNPPASDYSGGTLCVYTGGKTGASYQVEEDDGPPPDEIVTSTLAQLDTYMPGASAAWNGKAFIHVPTKDEWLQGSYSCPKPGEYTSIYGSELLPQGAVHFAGEHTSINFIGFMNGAVESGERAATEVIEALGGPAGS